MHILIMADYPARNSGNFIGSIHDLALRLQQQGGSLVLAVPKTDKGPVPWEPLLTKLGCPVLYLEQNLSSREQFDYVDGLIKTYHIDLIHIHFSCWIRMFCKYRFHWKNLPILAHDHFYYEVDSPLWKQKIRHWIHAAIYRFCRIGVISVMEKKHQGYFFCGKNHWYIPNAISFTRNVPQSMCREDTRSLLGIAPEEKLCLLLGWSMAVKGIDIAVKAVEACRKKGENVVLGIVGLGAVPPAEKKQWLLENTGISPDEPWIRYLPSTEDMYAYHRASDVYLSASRMEAFSYGILEAISQNVPVAVSRISGTMWASAYSKCVLFDNEDVPGCAQAISQALTLRDLPSNQDRMTRDYNIDSWCRQIMDIYQKYLP